MTSKMYSFAAAFLLMLAIMMGSNTYNTGTSFVDGVLGGLATILAVLSIRASVLATIREEKAKTHA